MSDTDRASCKLQCTSKRRAHQLRKDGVRQESGGRGSRPVAAGQASARPGPAPAPAPTSTAGGYTTVIEESKSPAQIAACQIGCDQAGLASTDRATCKLNCAATTRIVHVVPAGPPGGATTTSPAPTTGPTTGPTTAPTTAPAPAQSSGAALSACYDSCTSVGASDRVTCRLNCESAHRARATTPTTTAPPVQRPGAQPSSSVLHRPSGDRTAVAGCERSCDARTDLSSTDKATCKLGCSRHTSVVVEQWTSSAPASPSACQAGCQCNDRCLGHQQTCEHSCSGKSGSDAATCKLQCEAVFNSCHNACKVDGCTCTATGK